ncbi:hypothetical protein NU406_27520 [Klebsiella pneumoniae]|nr:hypothetical protein [Klebsiella pneumoniae]MCR6136196.1 hypothetical protein [Klebsiella pneumoniae]
MRIKLLSLFCGAVLGLSFSAAADVNGDMNNFFNKLGFALRDPLIISPKRNHV